MDNIWATCASVESSRYLSQNPAPTHFFWGMNVCPICQGDGCQTCEQNGWVPGGFEFPPTDEAQPASNAPVAPDIVGPPEVDISFASDESKVSRGVG